MKFRLAIAAVALLAVVTSGSLRAEEKAKELKCPVSGQPAKAEHKVAFNGGDVTFCCPNCPKAFEKDSEKFAAKANLQLLQSEQIKQVKCPIDRSADGRRQDRRGRRHEGRRLLPQLSEEGQCQERRRADRPPVPGHLEELRAGQEVSFAPVQVR